MYKLSYFQESDLALVHEFMRQHPFVVLCGVDAHGHPVATQVPVFIDEKDGEIFLTGHIMKNTDHHKAFEVNPKVLALFTGPHTYVSASWYTDKKSASTWNYITVHARGEMKYTDHQALLNILKRTTDHFENNPHSPSNFDQLPQDYVEKLSNAIVAFEIKVEELDNVFKLSQNHSDTNRKSIIDHLRQGDEESKRIAEEMAKRQ
ncbi:MAG TPA: FMN-binding negative transcriptional regulator [Chitinophagaceae bacterium]|nr:FMN-binding negative transcriptional regulator [Chitinophagaceae bacterium]